jgi:hypothetical protein
MPSILKRHPGKMLLVAAAATITCLVLAIVNSTQRVYVGQSKDDAESAMSLAGAWDISKNVPYFRHKGEHAGKKLYSSKYYTLRGIYEMEVFFEEDCITNEITVGGIRVAKDPPKVGIENVWIDHQGIELPGSAWGLLPMKLRTRN